MFIRKISRTDKKSGKVYYSYRLVESVRNSDGKVSQHLLLNLGANFNLPEKEWALLAQRIKQLLMGQMGLFITDDRVERSAKSYSKRIIKDNGGEYVTAEKNDQIKSCFECVDVVNTHQHTIRTVGGEQIAFWAIRELKLDKHLQELGFNESQIKIAIGQIVGRLLVPGSELSTHEWLRERSGLDELMGCDLGMIGRDQLYRASDLLLKHKKEIEKFLSQRERNLFNLGETITLYDLTNTYFEGSGKYNEKAQFGRSKEKRSDCRLVTLGLILDNEGFPKRSEIFAGNVGEVTTLQGILSELKTTSEGKKPTIIFDAGIVSEDNLAWLRANDYDYIVVSRGPKKAMPEGKHITVKEKGDDIVTVISVINEAKNEIELYCHSVRKAEKEQSIQDQSRIRFEEGLKKMASSLSKKNGTKLHDKVVERLGRLKEKYKRVSRFYTIHLSHDTTGKKVKTLTWEEKKGTDTAGVYCLRCSRMDLDEQTIWKTYISLTNVESAFRSMKSELGMRPVYHQKTDRVDGHLFITLLAYHVMQSIRYRLKQKKINVSWETIRSRMSTQVRITSTMMRDDGKAIHIRKSSVPDIEHRKIYDALSLPYYPGNTEKTVY